jgi:DNA-binding transcriptional LysR family regulator
MRLDLTRREADVALRLGNPVQETLVGRRVGRLAFAIYASAARHRAGIAEDLAHNDWIGFGSGHAPLRQVLADWLPGLRPQFRTNSPSPIPTPTCCGWCRFRAISASTCGC